MSWGERSCIYLYKVDKPCHPNMVGCNVNCLHYAFDGKTNPDSQKLNCDTGKPAGNPEGNFEIKLNRAQRRAKERRR